MKIREELETEIPDKQGLLAILAMLGYTPAVKVYKRRRKYKLANNPCSIELDEVDDLGKFVELEGESVEQVQEMIKYLGLADVPCEHEGYAQLLLKRRGEGHVQADRI